MWLRRLMIALLQYHVVMAKFGADNRVCDMAQFIADAKVPRGPSKPVLPDQYSVRIEEDVITGNYTQDIREYFDADGNRAALHSWLGGTETRLIMLYDTNELITLEYITPGLPPRCHVDDLVKSSLAQTFGIEKEADGKEHIFSANRAMKFGVNQSEVYLGRATARDGIIVDAWEACIYEDVQDTTARITWYFSAGNGDWGTAQGTVVPVEVDVYAVTHYNVTEVFPTIKKYVFTEFTAGLSGKGREFETTPGTYCPDRVSLRAPPNITNAFSFSAEIVEILTNYVDFIEEYYDMDNHLVRFDYASSGDNVLQIHLHDFNTGIAYIVDPMSGNCTVSSISSSTLNDKIQTGSTLHMSTSKEFFFMGNTKIQYVGQRTVRGISCDVFAALRNDYMSIPTLWEWYFATQDWMDNAGYVLQFYQPVMFHITSRDPANPLDVMYNIYDYSEGQQNLWKTDVTSCFKYTHRQVFRLTFPGSGKGNVTADPAGFENAIVVSAAMFAKITPLRVQDVQVDYEGENIAVSFTVLDSPPLPGDVNTTKPVISLSSAVANLNNNIDQGAFVVTLPNYVSLFAKRASSNKSQT